MTEELLFAGVFLDRLSSLLMLSLCSWLQRHSWILMSVTSPYSIFSFVSALSLFIYIYTHTHIYILPMNLSILISHMYLKLSSSPYTKIHFIFSSTKFSSYISYLFSTADHDFMKKLWSMLSHSSPLQHASNWLLILPAILSPLASFPSSLVHKDPPHLNANWPFCHRSLSLCPK